MQNNTLKGTHIGSIIFHFTLTRNSIILTVCCILGLIVISCVRDDISSVDYYKDAPNVGKTEICITKIKLNPVKVNSMETSYVGYFWLNRDTLYYSDKYYNYIFSLRPDGSIIKRNVGRGRGPNEVPDFSISVPFGNGYYLHSDNAVAYLFNNKWTLTGHVPINWGIFNPIIIRRINNPNPAEILFYGDNTFMTDHIQQWDSIHVAFYVDIDLPTLNGYMNAEHYYKYSRIIALVNVHTGEVERIFGRRSPVFLEKSNIPNMDYIGFAQVRDTVLVSFFPDSTVYMLDKHNDCAIGKFGRQGRNMNTAYVRTHTISEADERRWTDWETFGYYTYLKYDEKRQLLFRGYKQGAHSQYDGLQIYKNQTLLGDVDVPKGFYIVGYCNDQLIAAIEDEEINDLALYFYMINLEYDYTIARE